MFDSARRGFPARTRFAAAAAAVVLLFAIFLVAFPPALQAQEFGDWTVQCDNLRGCAAFGFPAENADINGVIAFRRDGDAQDAKAEVSLFVDGAKETAPLTLTIDGKPIEGVATRRTGSSGQSGREGFTTAISAGELAPFVAALRRGLVLTIAADGGKEKANISLRGAVASLLRMDDLQGRVGAQTALIRKGTNVFTAAAPQLPTISVPPLPDIKGDAEVAAKLRKAEAAYLAKNCDDVSSLEGVSDLVEPLDKTHTLVGLVCRSGAYNFATAFWIVAGADAATAAPVSFEAPGTPAGNVLTNVAFDRKTAALSFFDKGRGLGDCGVEGTYVWTGSKFALLSYAAMRVCRGLASQDWPAVWRAKVSEPTPIK